MSFPLLLILTAASLPAQQQGTPSEPPVTETQATQFANQLLGKMTLEEKLGQMTQVGYREPDSVPHDERTRKEQVGSFLFLTNPVEINRLLLAPNNAKPGTAAAEKTFQIFEAADTRIKRG